MHTLTYIRVHIFCYLKCIFINLNMATFSVIQIFVLEEKKMEERFYLKIYYICYMFKSYPKLPQP